MSWITKRLEDVADFTLGKMLDQRKNRGEPLPYLANVNVRWGTFELDDLRYMKFESHEVERYSLKYGDIVMCEGGEPGRCAIWKKHQPGMMIQKALHRIRPHDCLDASYLFYFFLHTGNLGGFAPFLTGATIKHLPREKLAKIDITFPPRLIQERISSIMSGYDDLIAINQCRIALLEESARLLYREWFVNFRFPGFEQVSLTNGLPDGWQTREVCSLVSFLNRGITPKYDESAKGLVINQKCIRSGRLNLNPARRQSKEVKTERLIQLGDILINSTGAGTLGRVAQVRSQIEDCTVDTHVTIARPSTSESISFLGVALLELEPTLSSMGVGSTNQLELGRTDIGAIKLLVPPATLQQEFHSRVWLLFEQVDALVKTNELLAHARNELLPKLMSGAIQV